MPSHAAERAQPPARRVSAIVMTNRRDDVVETALRSLAAQDHRPLELVLWGNGVELPEPSGFAERGIEVRLGHSPVDLGVAGGRNAAAKLATGDALLFLDDDALLHEGALTAATAALTGDVGAVALRVIDPRTRRTALWYYPVDREAYEHRAFDATHFLGGAGLVRRDLFEELGGFWEGYFREMEEIDFGWRLLSAGWRVRYEPAAVVEHPERVNRRLYRWSVPTNVAMAWRLLGPRLAVRQALVWMPVLALRAVRHGEVREFAQGLAATPATIGHARADPARLRPETVERLRALNSANGWGKRLQWSVRRRPVEL